MLSQKDLNDVVLENAATTTLLCILAAKLLSEKVTKDSLDESLKALEKGLVDEWQADEAEKPEGEQLRKYFVDSYREIVEVAKTMQKSPSQISADPEDSDPVIPSQDRGSRSKLPDSILKSIPKVLDLLRIVLKSDA